MPTSFWQAEGNIPGGVIASHRGTPRGRRTWACTKVSMLENREALRLPVLVDDAPSGMVRGVADRRGGGPRGERYGGEPSMNDRGKSEKAPG